MNITARHTPKSPFPNRGRVGKSALIALFHSNRVEAQNVVQMWHLVSQTAAKNDLPDPRLYKES